MNEPISDSARRADEVSGGSYIVLPGQTPKGEYVLSVLVKQTYEIVEGQPCRRAEEDAALIPADIHWGDPMNSSVRFETDFLPYKPATDVVLNGKVHAPGGKATASCRCALMVADRRRELQITGDRVARFSKAGVPSFSRPEVFTSMELKYEFAYGGIDVHSDKRGPYPYGRNPLGKGFVVSNVKDAVDGLALPNIEDPNDLITPERLCVRDYKAWEKQPFPAGLGWFPKMWRPRAEYAGVMPADRKVEQEMRATYAQFLQPADREKYLQHGLRDMDFQFFNGASTGLVFPYLSGGERIETVNLTPEGNCAFALPGRRPVLGLDIGGGMQRPETVLHTVMIRMEDKLVDLVWRAAVPYAGPDWLPDMRKMEVSIEGENSNGSV